MSIVNTLQERMLINVKKVAQQLTRKGDPEVSRKAKSLLDDGELSRSEKIMIEEYKVICDYIIRQDVLRWRIIAVAITGSGLIFAIIFNRFELDPFSIFLAILAGIILTIALVHFCRFYEYCRNARIRACEIEESLNMHLYRKYKTMKQYGLSANEIPVWIGWIVILTPMTAISVTIIILLILRAFSG